MSNDPRLNGHDFEENEQNQSDPFAPVEGDSFELPDEDEEESEDWEDDDYFLTDDDEGSRMSYNQQRAADLSDYAGELLRAGKIDEIQAAEIRMGA